MSKTEKRHNNCYGLDKLLTALINVGRSSKSDGSKVFLSWDAFRSAYEMWALMANLSAEEAQTISSRLKSSGFVNCWIKKAEKDGQRDDYIAVVRTDIPVNWNWVVNGREI